MNITCRMDRWLAPPGTIVEVEDMGPADGKWLVTTRSRDLFSTQGTVTLKKPIRELPEPAPEVVESSITAPGSDPDDKAGASADTGGGSGDAKTLAKAILQRCSFPNISLSFSPDGTARYEFVELARRGRVKVRSPEAGGRDVVPNLKMLQAILESRAPVNAMTGGDHSSNSKHYRGLAFDTTPGNGSIQSAVRKNGGGVLPRGVAHRARGLARARGRRDDRAVLAIAPWVIRCNSSWTATSCSPFTSARATTTTCTGEGVRRWASRTSRRTRPLTPDGIGHESVV